MTIPSTGEVQVDPIPGFGGKSGVGRAVTVGTILGANVRVIVGFGLDASVSVIVGTCMPVVDGEGVDSNLGIFRGR